MKKLLSITLMSLIILACKGNGYAEEPGYAMSRGEVFSDDLLNAAALAVEREDVEALNELVNAGLNINAQGKRGFNLLYWALRSNEEKSFETLLQLGADPDLLWTSGMSVTYLAARNDNSRYLALTLEYEANPNGKNTKKMDTPIHSAMSAKNLITSKLLIDKGADINFQNKLGNTPIMNASALRYYDFVDLLIQSGADHCIKNRGNKTLFDRLERDLKLMDKSSSDYQIVLKLLDKLPKCAGKNE